jgi:hypothetical protein
MAVRNQSNLEKTVKSTLRVMPSDTWSVDNVTLFCNYKNQIILPDGFILDEFRDYFEQFLEEVDLPEEFHYSPTLFSEALYGTPDLDFLVLYFSKIPSIFEFNVPRIRVLPATSLVDMNKLIVEYRQQVRNSKTSPTEYLELEEIKIQQKGYLDSGPDQFFSDSDLSSRLNSSGAGTEPQPTTSINPIIRTTSVGGGNGGGGGTGGTTTGDRDRFVRE